MFDVIYDEALSLKIQGQVMDFVGLSVQVAE